MSYSAQAQLSVDPDFIARVTACAAVEIPVMYDAKNWTETYIWRIAAAPGFADAYEYALNATHPERPGNDPGVITDAQILGAVQALYEDTESDSSTRGGAMSDIPVDLTGNDYVRIINRDRFVKEQLADRVAALVRENLELLSIIQELQGDLAALQQGGQVMAMGNGEVPQPDLFQQEDPAGVTS